MADRTIPEDEDTQKPNPLAKNSYVNPNIKKKAMSQYKRNALINKVRNKANGGKTPHQQHLEHEQHMANVKNNPQKYQPKRRGFD